VRKTSIERKQGGQFINFAEIGKNVAILSKYGKICNMHNWFRVMDAPVGN